MPDRPETRYLGGLPPSDVARINNLRKRLSAQSNVETIRRISITMETLLDHQKDGGDIVLCRKGVADKCIWFV